MTNAADRRGEAPSDAAQYVGRVQLERLGRLINEQRRRAQLSLRDLAARTNVSNPYLSQIERGLHEPSVRVLRAIAKALNMSAETLLIEAGLLDGLSRAEARGDLESDVEVAIEADTRLSAEQKSALLSVYRSYIDTNG